MSSLLYFFKESLIGFTRNLSTTLGSIITIFLSLLIIGVFLISVAAEGYLFAKVPILIRAVSAVTALLLINSSIATDVVGLALCAAIVVFQVANAKRQGLKIAF